MLFEAVCCCLRCCNLVHVCRYAKSQLEQCHQLLLSYSFGNTHSVGPCSRVTDTAISTVRERILHWLGASDEEWVLVFTDGATEALRLVGETFPWRAGSHMAYSTINHNSALGIREYAKKARATITPLREGDILSKLPSPTEKSLFVYPLEDNFSGKLLPLEWATNVKKASSRFSVSARYRHLRPRHVFEGGLYSLMWQPSSQRVV